MMLYRFEVDYTVPGKMGSKNYVTAVAATDAAHARVEAGKIFEGLKEDYGYDKAQTMRTVMASPIAYSMGTDAVEIAAGAATIELTVASAPSVISMVLKSKTCPNRLPK